MTEKKWYDNAVMVNRDPNWVSAIDASSKEACKAQFESYFSKYEGAVTDVLLGVLEQTTMTPSQSFMWRGEKYLQKTENGNEVSYPQLAPLYKAFAEYGVDGVQIFIDQMHKLGIRPWLTFRMNDAHFGDNETSFLRSDMFYEEKDAGHLTGRRYGYYGKLFDFRHERYRNAILGYIKETLNKYDIFGIELDFMREIICFDYLGHPEGIQEIILGYVREIKEYVSGIEKRVGHDIKISIRTCREPEDAYDFGFDIKTMVDEGLVDVVVVTPRWSPTDSALPIGKWRKLLGDDVAIMAGIETNNVKNTINTPENTRAYAAAFYAEGADGIYLNNHEYYTERNREAWKTDRESCLVGKREFVVTSQDCAAYNAQRYAPLPMNFRGHGVIPLNIGKVNAKDKVTLLIDFEGEDIPEADIVRVHCENGTVVPPLVVQARQGDVVLTEHTPVEYDMSGFETEGKIAIDFRGKGTVHYIKLTIDAK